MKKLALVLVLVLCASVANAQWHEDNIGLYLDAGATQFCDVAAGGGSFHVYLIGTQLTAGSNKGIEIKVSTVGGGAQQANWFWDYPAIDLGTRTDEHVIVPNAPEPIVGGQFTFAEFDLIVWDATEPTFGFLAKIYFDSNDTGLPNYLDGDDPTLETILPLRNSTGDPLNANTNFPVLILNGDCFVVPNEDASWGDVKALFK